MTTTTSLPYYHTSKYNSLKNINGISGMWRTIRVLLFVLGIVLFPSILISTPLYLRHRVFAERNFAVTESDVLQIEDGISTIFCQSHTLKMNSSFNAYQVNDKLPLDETRPRKHVKLSKSMTLPDDSLEYWGFFLSQGSTVYVSVCSRFEGAKLMVVKDTEQFHSCGLLKHDKRKQGEPHTTEVNDMFVTYENTNISRGSSREDEPSMGGEDSSMEDLEELKKYVERHLHKHTHLKLNSSSNPYPGTVRMKKRDLSEVMHKEGILHGKTENETSDSDVSSFEDMLFACHDGRTLLTSNFAATSRCTSAEYLEKGKHLQVEHKVHEDGYYYYIFYSDNDYVENIVHATFNIYKPSYEYGNYINACINETQCKFEIGFMTRQKVVVEIPTRDGIEHEPDDVTTLVSTCNPRIMIYAIFPIALTVVMLLFALV